MFCFRIHDHEHGTTHEQWVLLRQSPMLVTDTLEVLFPIFLMKLSPCLGCLLLEPFRGVGYTVLECAEEFT